MFLIGYMLPFCANKLIARLGNSGLPYLVDTYLLCDCLV